MKSNSKFESNRIGIILNILFLFAYISLGVLSILQAISEVDLTNRLLSEAKVTYDQIKEMLTRRENLSQITIIVYITCRSLFVNWAYYAHKNIKLFYPQTLKFNTLKMVLGFIIPVINFVWPILAVNEIYRASDPKIQNEEELGNAKISRMIIAWWILNLIWIAFSIWNNVCKVIYQKFTILKLMFQCTIVGDCLGIIVMAWTILIVLKIHKMQQLKYRDWILTNPQTESENMFMNNSHVN